MCPSVPELEGRGKFCFTRKSNQVPWASQRRGASPDLDQDDAFAEADRGKAKGIYMVPSTAPGRRHAFFTAHTSFPALAGLAATKPKLPAWMILQLDRNPQRVAPWRSYNSRPLWQKRADFRTANTIAPHFLAPTLLFATLQKPTPAYFLPQFPPREARNAVEFVRAELAVFPFPTQPSLFPSRTMEDDFPPPCLPEEAECFEQDSGIPQTAPLAYDDLILGHSQPPPELPDPIPGTDLGLMPNPDRSLNQKVPIPRSVHSTQSMASGRVSKACEHCRDKKAKCSGHRPACQRCQAAGTPCSYGDRKRERILKEFQSLTTQVQHYQGLLRDLYPQLNASPARRFDQTLGQLVRAPENLESHAWIAAAHHIEEDFNHDEASQAMGFVGEHSAITWLYRLKRDLDQDDTPIGDPLDRPSISSINYFQDTTQIAGPDDADVDFLARPPQPIANKLIEDYFQAVHPEFPIIGKETFLGQYRSFYANPTQRPGRRWVAVLNLVFAIATRRAHLAQSSSEQGAYNHTEYFMRAWRLSMGDAALLDHPNLQQVQVEGLAAFYLLSTGQINRSWRMIGIAIRSAIAMGLNFRIEGDVVSHFSKEIRYRVWWALFMLDAGLCVLTGRPPTTDETFRSTPLPLPYPEEDLNKEEVAQLITDHMARNALLASLLSCNPPTPQPLDASTEHTHLENRDLSDETEKRLSVIGNTPAPNISLYFLFTVDLTVLLREAIEILYAPRAAQRSWEETEIAIFTFNTNTDEWFARLPKEFRFGTPDTTRSFIRQRTSLGFRFYTTKLVISQPCLRRLACQPHATISSSVCDTMASTCVQVAGRMLDLLPDEADTDWLYGASPWWCVLHYVMQSTTILLIELFARLKPGSTEAAGLTEKVRKAIRWLRAMSANDPSSERAWLVCVDILTRHGSKLSPEIEVAN
ncbi:uncharacterized protein N7482_001485 [Penicillium canariense]|uniref:Zn(2)-C6 fungal-type domain-containing protein n=1 Tax=Penicillium canariense TaxID=189055 RepID=A0A9W9LSZ9_9EURO|nr:uncharacterized protein N7482_001485 [Penicillium canariense]KAJ5175608.1 hypothetical protein N7482_001485 [Penicillium canariense]